MKRLLFDRSIFHGNKFYKLRKSNLNTLVKKGKIKVYYTPGFLEETLLFSIHNLELFKEQWKFIISLNSSKWFKTPEDIVTAELGNNMIGRKYYIWKEKKVKGIIKIADSYFEKQIPSKEYNKTMEDIKRDYVLKKEFRAKRLEVREAVKRADYDFNKYVEDNAEWLIEKGIMPNHSNSSGYLLQWRNNRKLCRFTEQFIKSWFSTVYLPVVNHQLRVDKNDKIDAEQLAYLIWSDIMVSDDTRFMREAFHLLYGNSKKVFYTLPEFLEEIK